MSSSISKPAGTATTAPINATVPTLQNSSPTKDEAEEEIISPVATLFKPSQASPGPLTDLLADLFTPLLQKVEDLEQKVARLQTESASSAEEVFSLRRQMLVVQKNTGGSFYKFPELPLELRGMIWKCSLCSPRIVALQHDLENAVYLDKAIRVVGPSHAELYACRESRTEALKILRPLHYHNDIDDPFTRLSYYHPDGAFWILGNPGEGLQFTMENFRINIDGPLKVHTFACSWDKWYWDDQNEDYEWTFQEILYAGVEELILVIGDESVAQRGDVVFVEPTMSIKEVMPTKKSRRFINVFLWTLPSCTKRAKNHTWAQLAKHIEKTFDHTRQEYRDRRSEAIADGTTEKIMKERYDAYMFEINSVEWRTPRVRFMEVSTVEEQKQLQGR